MTTDPITLDDLMGKLIAIEKSMDARFNRVDAELQAIRDVVDNELCSHEQVTALERRVSDLSRTIKRVERTRV